MKAQKKAERLKTVEDSEVKSQKREKYGSSSPATTSKGTAIGRRAREVSKSLTPTPSGAKRFRSPEKKLKVG